MFTKTYTHILTDLHNYLDFNTYRIKLNPENSPILMSFAF